MPGRSATTLHVLTVPFDEYLRVSLWAERFAPAPAGNYSVAVARSHRGHRWICVEDNVVATLEFDSESADVDPVAAFLDEVGSDSFHIPVRFIDASMSAIPNEVDDVRIGFDPASGTVSILEGIHHISVSCAGRGSVPEWLDFGPDHYTIIPLGPAASFFETNPASPRPDDIGSLVPFVRMNLERGRATFTRDLRPWGLGVDEIAYDADVQYPVDVTFFPPVLMRELALADDPLVTVSFFHRRPHLVQFSNDDGTWWVEVSERVVISVRPAVVAALAECGWSTADPHETGPTADIEATRGDARVRVVIVPLFGDVDVRVRIECVVAEGVPESEELFAELGALNMSWPGEKVVHRDGLLVVATDVAAGSIPEAGRLADALVERARALSDVVGVFM